MTLTELVAQQLNEHPNWPYIVVAIVFIWAVSR